LKKSRKIVYIEALCAVIAWGISFVATKVALRETTPITVVWLRFGMGVIILGFAAGIRKQWAIPAKKDLFAFAGLGLLGITFHQWLQSTALVTAQASTAAWIVSTSPVFIALLGWLVLQEKLSWLRTAGILLATLGVMLVVSKGNLGSTLLGKAWGTGDILILISAFNWAIFSVFSRGLLNRHPATRMMFFVMLFGWLFSSVLFFAGSGLKEITTLAWDGWMGVLFLGIFCSGLAYIFWYDALQTLPASQAGVFLYIEPLVTLVVAAAMLGEKIVLASALGGGIILFGVWLVNRSSEK
jgi:drug/metabolite transporter (DMT)-like permease